MNDSKFDSFMNDVMAQKKSATFSWDTELGEKKEEIIALYTGQHISRRVIFDSLVKANIISEDRSFKAFSAWMARAIKRNMESNVEKDKRAHPVVDNED